MTKLLLGINLFFWTMAAGLCPSAVKAADENQDRTYPLDAGMYYTIKKGDTLWDLSQHFFDSPWVWPDLWQKNQQIPNPHWIYPGNRIRIYSRKGLEKLVLPKTPGPQVPAALTGERQEPSYFYYPAIDRVGLPVTGNRIYGSHEQAPFILAFRTIILARPHADAVFGRCGSGYGA